MKKTTVVSALFGALLCFQGVSAQQQDVVAAKEGVTFQEVINQLNKLVSSGSEEDKAQLKLEAEALVKHSDEDMIGLAATLYERFLDDEQRANEIRTNVEQKYPKGKTARSNAYNKIFQNGEESTSGQELETQYNAWATEFPEDSFEEKDRGIYSTGKIAVATQYAKENNFGKAVELGNSLKGTEYFAAGLYSIYNEADKENRDYNALKPLAKDAYDAAQAASSSEDEATKNGNNARYLPAIVPIYAEVLSHTDNLQEAIAITSASLENSNYGDQFALQNTQTLAGAYVQLGEKEKALETYEKFIIANGKDESIVTETQKLYNEVHGANANFETHLASLDSKASEALFAKYEKDMIKKEAPGFSLVNREGKDVSLADYKGKVVILDFWATWCGPCVVSFPGMQAAVNKYATDSEVEFLFIDTWQNEENYKELVENFMTEKNYNFHVLFDEMKDRSKAVVTAYEVKGIPTKVVIDKEGFIRFHNSGSEANVDKLVKELDTKIALAKKG